MNTTVYKVVRRTGSTLVSCFMWVWDETLMRIYKPGEWTYPHKGTRLAAFRTLIAAEYYRGESGSYFEIWEAEAEAPRTSHVGWLLHNYSMSDILAIFAKKLKPPEGSRAQNKSIIWCKKIRLIKRIK